MHNLVDPRFWKFMGCYSIMSMEKQAIHFLISSMKLNTCPLHWGRGGASFRDRTGVRRCMHEDGGGSDVGEGNEV